MNEEHIKIAFDEIELELSEMGVHLDANQKTEFYKRIAPILSNIKFKEIRTLADMCPHSPMSTAYQKIKHYIEMTTSTVITKLVWHPVSEQPLGDIYTAYIAVEEPNVNYESHKKLGMPTAPVAQIVLPAIYVWSEEKWMSAGMDYTPHVKYWTVVEYPR